MRFRIYKSPEGEGGNGDNPPIDQNIPPVDPNNPNPPKPPPPPVDLGDQLSKTFSSGINEGKKRQMDDVLATLRSMNIEVQTGDGGKPELGKTIATFVANATNSKEALQQLKNDYERQLIEKTQALNALSVQVKQKEIEHQLSNSIARFDVVNRKGAIGLFLATYSLDEDNGAIRVLNPDGSMVFDTKSGQIATLDTAVDMFLKQNDYLVKATARGDGVGETSRKGAPTGKIDPAKLQEAFMNEKDPAKKAALREQMLAEIGAGKR